MGDLEIDTRITGGDGAYEGSLPEDWGIWGPNGGFVGAVLLRAAGAHAELPRPASLAVTFLGRGEFAPVQLSTRTLRRTRRAEAVAVSMTQEGRPIAEATAWFVLDDLPSPAHDVAPLPAVARPDALESADERRIRLDLPEPPFRFFENVEQWPVDWVEGWPPTGPLPPVSETWFRFRPSATFADPIVDAGRLVVVLDTMGWPAATRQHAWTWPADSQPWVAPSLDLHVRFHRPSGDSALLFQRVEAPLAGDGLLTTEGRVWSEHGLLLGSSASQLLWTATG
ncbi:hypothetical protein BH10ACT1_BH10ACT1_10320 [soil metagenome]